MKTKFRTLLSIVLTVAFCGGTAFGQAGSGGQISLDMVTGLWNTDTVETGKTIIFWIRYNNDALDFSGNPATIEGVSSGFRIYSPSGAQWGSTSGDTLATIGRTQFDLTFTILSFGVTGADADTIHFAGAKFQGPGVPAAFNDTVYTITIGPISNAYDGGQICLDSSFAPPTGGWKWGISGAAEGTVPSWSGPHCFAIFTPSSDAVFSAANLTGDSLYFPAQDGSFTDRSIDITSVPTSTAFTAATSSGWLSVTPSGTTPVTITASVDPSGQSGQLEDTIVITESKKSSAGVLKIAVYFDVSLDVTIIGSGNLPTSYSLSQNYPNPFNPSTTINLDIPYKTHVTLSVYNVLGHKVATLIDRTLAQNSYEISWDGFADNGLPVASGIYFYRVQTDDYVQTKKMSLSK